jgi:excisionase family DNA binding protein
MRGSMSATAEDDYVSAEEAALILGVKLGTVYAYASRGRIRSYRQGIKRSRLYRRSELLPLVEIAPARPRASRLPRAEDWIPLTG